MALARLLVTAAGHQRAPPSGRPRGDDCPGPEDAQPTDRGQAGRRLIPAASGEERRREGEIGEPGATPRFLPAHPTGRKSEKCPQVEGHVLRLSGRRAKLRREGYGKNRDR
jgi:hypothetical protein